MSDLNAALVGAKISSPVKTVAGNKGFSNDNSFLAKIEALEQDLDTANSHLTLERERVGVHGYLSVVFLLLYLSLGYFVLFWYAEWSPTSTTTRNV